MPSNIIAFVPRASMPAGHRIQTKSAKRTNIIDLAAWVGRAIPRRTPHGVFFTTTVLATPGDIA